jgi:hypothetical protein
MCLHSCLCALSPAVSPVPLVCATVVAPRAFAAQRVSPARLAPLPAAAVHGLTFPDKTHSASASSGHLSFASSLRRNLVSQPKGPLHHLHVLLPARALMCGHWRSACPNLCHPGVLSCEFLGLGCSEVSMTRVLLPGAFSCCPMHGLYTCTNRYEHDTTGAQPVVLGRSTVWLAHSTT